MAERRMTAKTITDSDSFLTMSLEAQALYFHLNQRADDDGFINNPVSVTRLIGATKDHLEELEKKKFIIMFDSGVAVIKHFLINNQIRADRRHDTKYTEEMARLKVKKNGAYTLDNQVTTTCQPSDNQVTENGKPSLVKPSIDKSSLVKCSLAKGNDNQPTLEEVKAYCEEVGSRIDPERFFDYNNVRGWKINGESIKDWKTLLRMWELKEKDSNYLDDLAKYWDDKL